MQPADRVSFVKVLNGMAAMKPGGKLTPEAIDLFWESMRTDWTLEEFKAAANHLVKASKFMPNTFHFDQLRRAGEPTDGEAWAVALAACSHWRTPEKLPNGRVARAVAAVGGFRSIAMADLEHALPHVERRFKEAYNDLAGVEPVRQELPQIAATGARIALRGPASIANFLPNLQPPEDSRASLAPEEFRS